MNQVHTVFQAFISMPFSLLGYLYETFSIGFRVGRELARK